MSILQHRIARRLRLRLNRLAAVVILAIVAAACGSSDGGADVPVAANGDADTTAAGSSEPADGGDGVSDDDETHAAVDAEPVVVEAGFDWWFDDPCAGIDEVCMPPLTVDREAPTLHATPEGDGDCSPDDPCTFEVALEAATSGDVIDLAPGDYPPTVPSITTPDVTIQGPVDCCLMVPSLHIEAEDIRVLGVRFDTVVIMPEGDRTEIVGSRLGSLFVNGADEVQLVGSRLRPSAPGQDVIQVKARDGDSVESLRIEGNVIGPQDTADDRHTDCVQLLDGSDIVIERNIVLPCGDKAFQIRSGAGGDVGDVALRGNVIYECTERRDGCDGFHAIVWASTETTSLELRHNTIIGSFGLSTSGSTTSPGENLVAVGNIVASMPCGGVNADNLVYDDDPCSGDTFAALPAFIDAADTVGDVRLADPDAGPARASAPFGPGIDGAGVCDAPRVGAALDC